jgi:hypothetical protein
MLAIIAATLVLTTVVGGLITAFWIGRLRLHDPASDRAMHLELLIRLGSPVWAESS